ncbi:hypothetical protein GCM10027398_38100 [Azotobacter salinestris]
MVKRIRLLEDSTRTERREAWQNGAHGCRHAVSGLWPLSRAVPGKSRHMEQGFETVCYRLGAGLVVQMQMMPAGQLVHLEG